MIDFNTAKALADNWNIPYIETSAKVGTNVNKAFEKLAMEIMDKKENTVGAGDKPAVENTATSVSVDLKNKDSSQTAKASRFGVCNIL